MSSEHAERVGRNSVHSAANTFYQMNVKKMLLLLRLNLLQCRFASPLRFLAFLLLSFGRRENISIQKGGKTLTGARYNFSLMNLNTILEIIFLVTTATGNSNIWHLNAGTVNCY